MRIATLAAAVLACSAVAMAGAALTADGEPERAQPVAAPEPAVAGDGDDHGDGKAVWAAQGCGSCHAFAAASATGQFGPDLAVSLEGMPDRYIRESIVEPSRVVAPGFSGGMMPEDYAARMSPAELARLVDFIRSGVPG